MHTNTTVNPTAKRVALAGILFAVAMFGAVAIDPAAADARPPKETEDYLAQAKAECLSIPTNAWGRRGTTAGPGYACTGSFRDGRQDQLRYNTVGTQTAVCYRLDIESPWLCV
jgi:hypothetical protein